MGPRGGEKKGGASPPPPPPPRGGKNGGLSTGGPGGGGGGGGQCATPANVTEGRRSIEKKGGAKEGMKGKVQRQQT